MISVVIPAYNEEESIGTVIDEVRRALTQAQIEHEILVVDDASRDKTASMAIAKKVRVISHSMNRGYGVSLKTGIDQAHGEYVAIMDADGTYCAADLVKILQKHTQCDMVVGARISKNVQIPFMRRPAKWCITQLANYLVDTTIPDLNSGLRVFKKEVVKLFYPILPSGFSFTTTITLAMLTNNYKVDFCSIDYRLRKGHSKIRPFQDTVNFIFLILRTVLYFDPLRIFVPISLMLFAGGALIFIYSVGILGRLMDVTVVLFFLSGLHALMIGMLADLINKRMRR